MRPKKPETTGKGDLFRAKLDQIIILKHELALIGLWLLKHIYGLSDEGVSER